LRPASRSRSASERAGLFTAAAYTSASDGASVGGKVSSPSFAADGGSLSLQATAQHSTAVKIVALFMSGSDFLENGDYRLNAFAKVPRNKKPR
jgi:hypothetical protein